ncbi:MAG: ACP phosphodiesterase [Saprospiraceae bacterium]
MNYLAHAYLSFGNEQLLVGNLMGDFVKGRKQFEKYPKSIQEGIVLHRHIDFYSDNHLILKQSIKRLKPTQQRYAPVVVDIFYDYFLANNWSMFSEQSLNDFALETYTHLERNFEIMPKRSSRIFKKMISHNWLVGYQQETRIEYAFQRLATRVSNKHNMLKAIDDLRQHKEALNNDFIKFFPELIQSAKAKITEIGH